jgi:hypothetical protein
MVYKKVKNDEVKSISKYLLKEKYVSLKCKHEVRNVQEKHFLTSAW